MLMDASGHRNLEFIRAVMEQNYFDVEASVEFLLLIDPSDKAFVTEFISEHKFTTGGYENEWKKYENKQNYNYNDTHEKKEHIEHEVEQNNTYKRQTVKQQKRNRQRGRQGGKRGGKSNANNFNNSGPVSKIPKHESNKQRKLRLRREKQEAAAFVPPKERQPQNDSTNDVTEELGSLQI
eukprot:CAMPEP_0168536390 /NCGR_PEP_ID=MMETSP0405-20121227/19521_1 /TAXON_ID=498012 /ORGANISM="Trichosphaerium sp, Strain Am-I-7 wt" /LENGTH=179 /DNA_ID=CAMNT_0008564387 /DNA_START=159 /DNA_END=698 /DNA_ORIENTATION=+